MTITPRALCENCGRPPVVCWCAHAVTLRTRTRVVILQHPRERHVAIGTIAIAARCLPDALVARDVTFDPARLDALLHGDPARPPVLLFPTDDARDLRADPFDHDVTLVLLDGTWALAAKLLARNPALQALPRVRFTPSQPSRYRIRREPAAHCVASIEALSEALGVLERDPARYEALLPPFVAMIDHQLRYPGTATSRRHQRPRGPKGPPKRVRTPLDDVAPESVVLAYGEASAWPRGTADAPADEVLHWVAVRPHTGERFEALAKPSRPMAKSFPHHAELAREALDDAVSREEFVARWQAFVRDGDTLLTWGTFAADLLAADGFPLPARIDLRAEVVLRTRARPPTLDEVAVGPDAWRARGRAGRRLAAMGVMYAARRRETP